jgi:hypothetical protein
MRSLTPVDNMRRRVGLARNATPEQYAVESASNLGSVRLHGRQEAACRRRQCAFAVVG